MNKILDTVQIDSQDNSMLIDLVKDYKGKLSIQINQANSEDRPPTKLSIDSSTLTDVIKALQTFHAIINVAKPLETRHITPDIQHKVQQYYFKGVEIDDIANLLGQSKQVIIQNLEDLGIEITSNKIPKPKKRWYRRKK